MAFRDEFIVGGRELDRLLQTLPVKIEQNILRGAMRAGANPIKQEVIRRAPVDTGQLRASIRITSRSRRGQASASVKVGNAAAWYAHLIEFGTRNHEIKARLGGALGIGGKAVKKVMHPGIEGKPFIRPAADATIPDGLREVTKYIRKRLTNEGLNTRDTAPRDPEE